MDVKNNMIRKKSICQNRHTNKNEMLIITIQHVGTYTMAKLTEALGGENSMSEPSQQLRKQLNTQMLDDHTSANTLVIGTQLHTPLI